LLRTQVAKSRWSGAFTGHVLAIQLVTRRPDTAHARRREDGLLLGERLIIRSGSGRNGFGQGGHTERFQWFVVNANPIAWGHLPRQDHVAR